ncbi:helix-turn-helix transcriptional regulator [Clostridium botulinum]|uniref:helix-turn-helix transcriptional regulator n=1 Tax=Clostridium botulinum TaxID=1491 RepID=UPI0006A4FDB2|nr:helix-turn-helix transcriptional regulator [Clostridium botulinum]KOC49968.1 XRE family transcriptional regulator [Clostridium botulinum]
MRNNIKKLLKKHNVKATEIIQKTGLSRSYFYDVMKGNSIPSLIVARKIACAMDVRLEELFPSREGD